jgi:hypothetical protein
MSPILSANSIAIKINVSIGEFIMRIVVVSMFCKHLLQLYHIITLYFHFLINNPSLLGGRGGGAGGGAGGRGGGGRGGRGGGGGGARVKITDAINIFKSVTNICRNGQSLPQCSPLMVPG